jgi:hypothetical protein
MQDLFRKESGGDGLSHGKVRCKTVQNLHKCHAMNTLAPPSRGLPSILMGKIA